ncbi:MAG: hypothetical protein WCA32_03595 [Chromatiaceae bacterium]
MAIRETPLQWRQRRAHNLTFSERGDDPPLRAELFSTEQMEQHGQRLGAAHVVMRGHPRDPLLARLAENEKILQGHDQGLIGVDRLLAQGGAVGADDGERLSAVFAAEAAGDLPLELRHAGVALGLVVGRSRFAEKSQDA